MYSTSSKKPFPNSKVFVLVISLLLIAMVSVGCQHQKTSSGPNTDTSEEQTAERDSDKKAENTSSDESEDQISEGARKIIETFMNCPNSDYYTYDHTVTIGLNTDEDKAKADLEKARAAQEQLMENWDKAVGQYFSPNCLESFFSANARYYYDQYAGKTVEVQNMELIEKTKDREYVKVTILVDGNEQEEQIRFRKNSDGTIWQVGIWLEEYSNYI